MYCGRRSRPDSGWLLFRSTVPAQVGPPQAPSFPQPSTGSPTPLIAEHRKCPLPGPLSAPTPPRARRLVLQDPSPGKQALRPSADADSSGTSRSEPQPRPQTPPPEPSEILPTLAPLRRPARPWFFLTPAPGTPWRTAWLCKGPLLSSHYLHTALPFAPWSQTPRSPHPGVPHSASPLKHPHGTPLPPGQVPPPAFPR